MDERKTVDEMMLEVVFEVRALRKEFTDLRGVVEKREPAPRRAVWLATIALVVIAVGFVWDRFEHVAQADNAVHARAAGRGGD